MPSLEYMCIQKTPSTDLWPLAGHAYGNTAVGVSKGFSPVKEKKKKKVSIW